ncbi:hypothetical protein N007_15745 [Alicyclobacillus acidoterrestris ATCC 49025]|nr:hypothetical protein N007_15745 [Alicyclobacillus acidoterrestris ATCC 49025]
MDVDDAGQAGGAAALKTICTYVRVYAYMYKSAGTA